MKKLLVLLMVLVMSVSILSSCKKEKENKEDDDKEIVESIVCTYIECIFNADNAAGEFVAEGTGYLSFTDKTISNNKEMFALFENVSTIPEDRIEEVEKIRVEALEKYIMMFDYKIKDVEVDGDKAKVTVKLTAPDVSELQKYKDYADEESKKGFSQEEVQNISSVENVVDIPKETFLKAEKLWFEAFIKNVGDSVSEKEITYELKLTEYGWLITGEKN